jgi:diguanylate cyclase (GGDEF)-like protein
MPNAAMSRLLDVLLSTDPVQRVRLAQAGLAMLVLATAVAAMHYFVWAGTAQLLGVWLWSAGTLAGMVVFFVLIRSGWSRSRHEPSLTVPQMLFALTSGAVAYALLGAGRGAVFPVVMVILMFGMFIASPRQMRWVSAYAVLLFGATMALMTLAQPAAYPAVIEVGHFLLVATMVPAVSLLAARLSRIRHRSRLHRAELAQALSRLREHTTRDELTGLINRRHMQELMEQEHQRCIRSGQSFCLAMLDIDRFKPVNEAHGYAVGDAVLRAVAQEALRQVRVSDMLSRWGGDDFVLMMSDTRATLASGGLERLQQRVGALRILHGNMALSVSITAGLAEHHAGETVMQTLERAERALHEAQAHGRDRVVVAA